MCLIEDQSWIDYIDITSRWDTFVLYHLYGNKGVSLPLWPIRPRWFHTFCPCAEPLGDGYEGMWARFGSQGSIALNWHSRYSGTRYSGTWLYKFWQNCALVRLVSDLILKTVDMKFDHQPRSNKRWTGLKTFPGSVTHFWWLGWKLFSFQGLITFNTWFWILIFRPFYFEALCSHK